MTTAPSGTAIPSQPPRRGRRAWRWAAPAAVLAAGGVYLAMVQAQSDQPYLDQPVGWTSRPVLSNNILDSGNEVIYRPVFNKTTGQGSLFANRINAFGITQNTSPWTNADAGVLLKTQTDRRIFTANSAGQGIAFTWASLSSTQQAALGNATTGPQVLSYLRGDASNEGTGAGQFRIRATPLGSIMHSTLLRWNHGSAGQRLYVGANDGMLHAFDAATGRELFAYIPSMLIPRLSVLAQPTYRPQAYVNGPLNISNFKDGDTIRTLLVGGLGNGGRGLFMLDVSAASFASEAAAASTLKWEISPATPSFANLGYTYAMPQLAWLENNTLAVVVGNGYRSDSGKATLYVINALTGALIREIDTGVGNSASRNGLSSPTVVDTDRDGKADTAYAGDLQGNMWKFNLSGGAATRLFTPSTPAQAQAITTAPAVRGHPIEGQLVIFGTGQTLVEGDLRDTSVHAVYGLWDGAPSTNQTLLEQTVSEVTVGGKRWRTTTNNPINWDNADQTRHKGWKLSLPAGERVVGESPYISQNRFVFVSMNPTTPSTANKGPGENWLTQVSVFNGGSPNASIFDVNSDGLINSGDLQSGKVVNGHYLADGVVSQPVLTDLAKLSRTLYNYNPEIALTATPGGTTTETVTETVQETVTQTVVDTQVSSTPPLTTPGGVSNGHFDVDIYYKGKSQKHVHEYDDKYNVVGVNFLNPSETAFRASNAFSNGTQFKVLVVNQYLNPASMLRVGSAGYVRVKDFQGQASATNSGFVSGLPVFRLSNMGSFVWALPVDAFQSKDWWGDGGVRAGLMPTQTGCVKDGFNSTPGRNGEIYNGSLTLQMIKPETPASALELNYPAGGPKYGWRVKAAQRGSYVLGEYTMFWHHPNGRCYNQSGWVPNPPQDRSGGGGGSPPRGSGDPTGTVNPTVDGPVTVVDTRVTVNGNVTTTVVTYSNGATQTTTQTSREVTTTVPKTVTRIVETEVPGVTKWTYRNGEEIKTDGPPNYCKDGYNLISREPCCEGDGCKQCTTEKECCEQRLGAGNCDEGFPNGRFSWRELRSSN